MNKSVFMYIVETTNTKLFRNEIYYEEAETAQKAVNRVRKYMSSDEMVYSVSRIVKGWK